MARCVSVHATHQMLWSVICVMFWWEAWVLFASLHICDLQEGGGMGRFECCLAILMLDSKESGSQGRSRRETERWIEGNGRKEKKGTQNYMECLWSRTRDYSANRRKISLFFFFLLDICYGLTSLVRMMQVESCPSLFSKRASEVRLL